MFLPVFNGPLGDQLSQNVLDHLHHIFRIDKYIGGHKQSEFDLPFATAQGPLLW